MTETVSYRSIDPSLKGRLIICDEVGSPEWTGGRNRETSSTHLQTIRMRETLESRNRRMAVRAEAPPSRQVRRRLLRKGS